MADSGSMFDRLRSLFGLRAQKPAVVSSPKKSVAARKSPPAPVRHDPPRTDKEPPGPAEPRTLPPEVGKARITVSAPAKVDLVLGIDFGTSCTKVAIGDPGWLGQSYAVPIGDGSGIAKFLRTTRVQIGGRTESNLKMRLMDDPDSIEVQDLAALYLAEIVRESLDWFSAHGPRRYKERQPVWSLTLGFPAKRVDEEGALATAYNTVGELAARLGSSDLPLTSSALASLREVPEVGLGQQVISSNRFDLYPEIAAQLASYVNSPFRPTDNANLILIDVGAGTLDVSTAILHQSNGEDVTSFHCCEVGPYGAAKLMAARAAALEEVMPGSVKIEADQFQSGTEPTPESLLDFVGASHPTDEMRQAFEAASINFSSQAINLALRCAMRFRKAQRDGHANASYDPWPGQVRFFFTGGGSRLGFYRRHFVDGPFEQELRPFTRWSDDAKERRQHRQGLRLEPLPAPHNFIGFPGELGEDFDRLSVAHGLAYGRDNLMKVTASE